MTGDLQKKRNNTFEYECKQLPVSALVLPDGTNLRKVTVLPKAEWERIEYELNHHQIEIEHIQRIQNELKERKKRSQELVRTWSNTLAGQRHHKLVARKIREEKEEAERQEIDVEEAKYQAEQRRQAIEKAKTKQYYQTDRVKAFHSALQMSEVLKERDTQLELKQLKTKAYMDEDKDWLEQTQKEYQDSIARVHQAALRRVQAAEDNVNFIKKQIAMHHKEREMEISQDKAEGMELKKLSAAYEQEKERLENIHAEERHQLMLDNRQQILDTENMKLLKDAQEEEENEECHVFATAKRKMMRKRIEKEKEMHVKKQEKLKKICSRLAGQMKEAIDNEDERIEQALQEKEETYIRGEKEKEGKNRKMLQEQEHHRTKQMHDSGQKKKLARREEMEQVNLRKNADEVFSQHEMEKARRQHDADKDRVRFLFAQTDEAKRNRDDARQLQLALDQANNELVEQEEKEFQEYARKVIDHCDQNARNVYPLRRAAKEGAGGGLGPIFPGKGGVRPSYIVNDRSGVQLPCYRRSSTEHVKQQMYGQADSRLRLGFIW